jgi:hypothetical protein
MQTWPRSCVILSAQSISMITWGSTKLKLYIYEVRSRLVTKNGRSYLELTFAKGTVPRPAFGSMDSVFFTPQSQGTRWHAKGLTKVPDQQILIGVSGAMYTMDAWSANPNREQLVAGSILIPFTINTIPMSYAAVVGWTEIFINAGGSAGRVFDSRY